MRGTGTQPKDPSSRDAEGWLSAWLALALPRPVEIRAGESACATKPLRDQCR